MNYCSKVNGRRENAKRGLSTVAALVQDSESAKDLYSLSDDWMTMHGLDCYHAFGLSSRYGGANQIAVLPIHDSATSNPRFIG
jgi:hypothetical protein